MRMIVEAFKDYLELGLEKPKQTVVRIGDVIVLPSNTPDEPICFLETPYPSLEGVGAILWIF